MKLKREYKTIQKMIYLTCYECHSSKSKELCPSCIQLLSYVNTRLDKCPYQEHKASCVRCPIHCYKPGMREQIIEVMRYAGPRMLRRHPILAVCHLWDNLKTRKKS